jgi:hypothetical protein
MGWGTYVNDRVEELENDLRHVPVADRANIDYILAWAGLRDARILAQLPHISPDLQPLSAAEPLIPAPAVAKHRHWWASNWWTGDRAERAYAALHRADAAYLAVAPDAIVRQRAADLLGVLPVCGLPTKDPRYAFYQKTLASVAALPIPKPPNADPAPVDANAGAPTAGSQPATPPVGPSSAAPLDAPIPVSVAMRQTLKEIGEVIGQALAGTNHKALTYRNLLLCTASGLFALYLVLSLVGWRNPNFLSLCASNASLRPPCPSGNAPGAGDIFLLGFAGLVGGAVGALVLLLSVSVSGAPFTIAIAQALLKLPTGAVISLVALFVLQHGTLGILMPQSGSALVAWALLFGVGQQVVTQTIDKRANDIMAGGPSSITTSKTAKT